MDYIGFGHHYVLTVRAETHLDITASRTILRPSLVGEITSMMILARTAAVAIALISYPALGQMTDAQIKQKIIDRSISNYSGNCPCPYNVMRNGRRCGGNSAYSRPGGASPKCYPSDVTQAEIRAYRG